MIGVSQLAVHYMLYCIRFQSGNISYPEYRFPAISHLTVCADFESGVLSSDFEPLILQGINRQIGDLAGAVRDNCA